MPFGGEILMTDLIYNNIREREVGHGNYMLEQSMCAQRGGCGSTQA